MRDRIRDLIVARILDQSYAPGTRLKELVLAQEFGVSQAPVREALRELEAMGLVTSERYRGTQVRGVDVEALQEAYELRAILQVRSIELAVPLPAETLKRLVEDLEEMRATASPQTREVYTTAALRLHRRLVEASGNRVFLQTWDAFHWQVRGRVALYRVGNFERLKPLLHLHGALVEALLEQQTSRAVDTVREIFRVFGQLMTEPDEP